MRALSGLRQRAPRLLAGFVMRSEPMGRKAASVLPEAVAAEMMTSLPPLRMTGMAFS